MRLTFIDIEFHRQDVTLVESCPYRFIMFAAIISPAQLFLDHAFYFIIMVVHVIQGLDNFDFQNIFTIDFCVVVEEGKGFDLADRRAADGVVC